MGAYMRTLYIERGKRKGGLGRADGGNDFSERGKKRGESGMETITERIVQKLKA